MQIREIYLFLAHYGFDNYELSSIPRDIIESIQDDKALFTYTRLSMEHKLIRTAIPLDDDFLVVLDNIRTNLLRSDDLGIRTITCLDADYPERLKSSKVAIPYLFIRGNYDLLNTPGIAVFGTRKPSDRGFIKARQIGHIVGEGEFTLISGLSDGCDSAAHEGFLENGGGGIALVANTLDKVFARKEAKLAQKIYDNGGCLISTYLLGNDLRQFNYIRRDKVQAGLSDGLLVVELGVRGRTKHAIAPTLIYDTPLACCSFDERHYVNSPNARGNVLLLKEKNVFPITDATSVMAFMQLCRARIEG